MILYVFDYDNYKGEILNICVSEYTFANNTFCKNNDKRLYLQTKPKKEFDDFVLHCAYNYGVSEDNVIIEIKKITDCKDKIYAIFIEDCFEKLKEYLGNKFSDLPEIILVNLDFKIDGNDCDSRIIF